MYLVHQHVKNEVLHMVANSGRLAWGHRAVLDMQLPTTNILGQTYTGRRPHSHLVCNHSSFARAE